MSFMETIVLSAMILAGATAGAAEQLLLANLLVIPAVLYVAFAIDFGGMATRIKRGFGNAWLSFAESRAMREVFDGAVIWAMLYAPPCFYKHRVSLLFVVRTDHL